MSHFDEIRSAIQSESRVAVVLPPRHGATTFALDRLADALREFPDRRYWYSTYEINLAVSHGKTLALRVGAKEVRPFEWRTARGGGFMVSLPTHPMCGVAFDGIIVDAPQKSIQHEIENARDIIDQISTRIITGGQVLIIGNRWSKTDFIGAAEKTGFKVLRCPAMRYRKPLWPEKWSRAALEAKRQQIGERAWRVMYQGIV